MSPLSGGKATYRSVQIPQASSLQSSTTIGLPTDSFWFPAITTFAFHLGCRAGLSERNPSPRQPSIAHFRSPTSSYSITLSSLSEALLGALGFTNNGVVRRIIWTCGDFRHLGVIFFGYNTSEELDDWANPTQRATDDNFAKMIGELISFQKDSPQAVPIGLLHHPIRKSIAGDGIANSDLVLKNFSSLNGTVVTLHGHVHQDVNSLFEEDGISVLQIIASTFTKQAASRPEDSLRGFNMVTFERKSGVVTSVSIDRCQYGARKISVSKNEKYKRNSKGRLQKSG